MKPSDELLDLTLRCYCAIASRDISFFQNHLSSSYTVLVSGMDVFAWWSGHTAIIEGFRRLFRSQPQYFIAGANPQAYAKGAIGWVADRALLRVGMDVELPFRLTALYQKEDGAWKILQWHASIGRSTL